MKLEKIQLPLFVSYGKSITLHPELNRTGDGSWEGSFTSHPALELEAPIVRATRDDAETALLERIRELARAHDQWSRSVDGADE